MTRYPKQGKGNPWTVKALENVPIEWVGDTLADSGGLFGEVRLTKAGAISIRFRYRFRFDGKACWHQCGMWPAVSLAQIRAERDRARQQVALGVNPSLAKQAAKIEKRAALAQSLEKERQDQEDNLTISDLFQQWLKNGVARMDGNAEIRSAFAKHVLPVIGDKPLRLLTESDLLDTLRKAKERIIRRKRAYNGGNAGLLQLASLLKQMLYWAEKRPPWRGLLIAGNPADLINVKTLLDSDYQRHRDRVLTADEIRQLHIGLLPLAQPQEEPVGELIRRFRFAIWLCLSTLCRIGELVAAKWEHIDWQASTWHIPATNTKGQRGKRQAQLVFLSAFALEQFRQLHAETGDSVYCFPQVQGRGLAVQAATASAYIAKHQGGHYPLLSGGHWTLHDMRRTGATLMQSLGITQALSAL